MSEHLMKVLIATNILLTDRISRSETVTKWAEDLVVEYIANEITKEIVK